jgi:poly(A) polymerase
VTASRSPSGPRILSRAEHGISRSQISQNALKVLYRLKDAGYEGYLVGGGVRDLLLGREPKDFDIATDARPEEVRQLFRNCRLIGRRFRLAHVHFGREIIEVATFRAPHDEAEGGEGEVVDGRIVRDNVYGTLEQDAWRRDFTANALYYNIADFSVVDYTEGVEDLRAGLLRPIGDPEVRFREDPVRMLRAVRFAAKLGFRIEAACERHITGHAELLETVAPARLFDEVLKLFHGGCALNTFEMLRHYGLFEHLFPLTEEALTRQEGGFPLTFVSQALNNTDSRINQDLPVTPAFLYAVMLWEPVRREALLLEEGGMASLQALQAAGGQVLAAQARHITIPKRFAFPVREIWEMQAKLERFGTRRALRLLTHPRFRAAYDFFCLRAKAGETSSEACDWWTDIQEADEARQLDMTEGKGGGPRPKRRRRPRKRRPASHGV